jgi:hypothetical protein
MSDFPTHLLPPKLREIAEFCGVPVAMKLLAAYPGLHLVVPKRPPPEHRLVEVIGWEAAVRFCDIYGGDIIQIPRAVKAYRALRDARIRAERRQGDPLSAIALRHGLTERQVGTILGQQADAPLNGDLFAG